MILPVLASLLLGQVLGKPIIAGQLSDIKNHRWLVSIQKDGRHHCGGSIIFETIILTAAHCISGHPLKSFSVRVGSSRTDSGGSLHDVTAARIHEDYTAVHKLLLNDLALIEVSPVIASYGNVAKIQLPQKNYSVAPGKSLQVAGWGAQTQGGASAPELSRASLRVIDSRSCSKTHGDVESGTWMSTNKRMCAIENSSRCCQGDAGGPIVVDDIQVGIVSWARCSNHEQPAGVYVYVADYRDWIDKNFAYLRSPKRT